MRAERALSRLRAWLADDLTRLDERWVPPTALGAALLALGAFLAVSPRDAAGSVFGPVAGLAAWALTRGGLPSVVRTLLTLATAVLVVTRADGLLAEPPSFGAQLLANLGAVLLPLFVAAGLLRDAPKRGRNDAVALVVSTLAIVISGRYTPRMVLPPLQLPVLYALLAARRARVPWTEGVHVGALLTLLIAALHDGAGATAHIVNGVLAYSPSSAPPSPITR